MDFFEHQSVARRKSGLLLLLFCLAVVGLILAVWGLFIMALGLEAATAEGFIGTSVVIGGLVGLGTLYRISTLSAGGAAIASQLGGEPLDPAAVRQPAERRLLNVVEEMALAAGVPVPQVYLLRNEQGINAFAAGQSTGDAVIGVTRGALESLSRDELQGVIAHEFSHILNGDMRINLRLIGLLFGIMMLTLAGRLILRLGARSSASHRSSQGGGHGALAMVFLGFGLMVVGSIGVFFGNLIKAAVSRQREFLADASAVQFTRNPDGIAGALKKLGALAAGGRLESAAAEEASHLFFADGLKRLFGGWMATHPPLVDRVKALDPSFDGDFSKALTLRQRRETMTSAGSTPATTPLQPAAATVPPAITTSMLAPVGELIPPVGQVLRTQLDHLPPRLVEASRELYGAAGLIVAMVLQNAEPHRSAQLEHIEDVMGETFTASLGAFVGDVAALPNAQRLSFLDLVIEPLRALSPQQYEVLARLVRTLMEWDAEMSLFEYCVHRAMLRHLDHYFGFATPPRGRVASYVAVAADVVLVLAMLAKVSSESEVAQHEAFQRGLQSLTKLSSHYRRMPSPDLMTLSQFDLSLDRLAELGPKGKREVLKACVAVALSDRHLRPDEIALIRAIADSLDCPIPPAVLAPPVLASEE